MSRVEETLDPQDWQAMRELGHRMVDDLMTMLETVRDRPVWHPIPEEVKSDLMQPLPHSAQGAEAAYQDFLRDVLPNPMGSIHPRFWGWVIGTGTPLGALAEMLAAGLNPNLGGGDHVANYVELQVLDWVKEMVGYPMEASGILVSGGSVANLLGLAVARSDRAGFDIRKHGLQGAPARLVLYASREAHSSIEKAVELMGLGTDALRLIPVDAEYRIDLGALKHAIAEDRGAGHRPFCVVGNAGTVNTGAIDDLEALADLCQREKLWFHVDGAFGALAAVSPELRPLVKGMERADSLAFDLHKWMYMPFEVGCTLVRSELAHRHTFSLTPDYLAHGEGGLMGGSHRWLNEYGIQLTRGFRALKVWMSIKEHGIDKYGRLIRQNVEQAQYLGQLVRSSDDLELLAPVPLNIVCFRYRVDGMDEDELNALNQALLVRLHESGIAAPSYTTLDGKYALRAAITNHRSRFEDFDIMIDAVRRFGRELAGAKKAQAPAG